MTTPRYYGAGTAVAAESPASLDNLAAGVAMTYTPANTWWRAWVQCKTAATTAITVRWNAATADATDIELQPGDPIAFLGPEIGMKTVSLFSAGNLTWGTHFVVGGFS